MVSDRNIYVHIPSSGYPAFRILLDLSESKFQEFVTVLHSTPPASSPSQFAHAVASTLGEDREGIESIVDAVSSLVYVRESARISNGIVIDEVITDLHRSSKVPLIDDDEERLRDRLETLLGIEESLGVVAKAAQLWGERERILQSARILTDIRPVFSGDTSEDITNAMIIHTLSIEYTEDRRRKTMLFAIHNLDIQDMLEMLGRAESKAIALSRLLDAVNVRRLEDA